LGDSVIETAPERIWLHQLRDMLEWYERNICAVEMRDPRGHVVRFSPERFPHLIKLLQKDSTREVNNPGKQVNAIRSGAKENRDFGGYEAERFQTLTWTAAIIARPTRILELMAPPLVGKPKAGDTIYVKEFRGDTHGKYRFKILICKRVGPVLLVPVTCHPQPHDNYSPKVYRQVYP
jgi:hypothetical protein